MSSKGRNLEKMLSALPALVLTLSVCVLAVEVRRAQLDAWWAHALAHRVPVLPSGDGRWRSRVLYGAGSDYGRLHDPPLPARFYYEQFRFARNDIPRLCRALRIPDRIRTPSGCALSGEEAFLIYLRRRSYATRLCDLVHMFGRSSGQISEVDAAVRAHLYPLAQRKLTDLDHEHLRIWAPLYCQAIHWKTQGAYSNMFGFIDCTFTATCRPQRDGYRGPAQAAAWDGYHRRHGFNCQVRARKRGAVPAPSAPPRPCASSDGADGS